jgi:hypothetical protein
MNQKRLLFQWFRELFKIDSTGSTYLWNRPSVALEIRELLSLLTIIESTFASNFYALSRGVLPTVKYSGSLLISTSMISMVALMVSMTDKSFRKRFSAALILLA